MADPALREIDLDELLARLARGDRSAFEPLYTALRPRALRLARAKVGDADACDVAQAALLRVFARASEFEPGRPCLPWFYAIVANELRAKQRSGARLVLDEAATASARVADDDAEERLARHELERALSLAVEALDEDAAEAISAVLGRAPPPPLPAATLRKRVSRAYAKLRLILGGPDVD